MQRYFKCTHCGQQSLLNPRLKGKQHYCCNKACQQARKNKWERDKIKNDKLYRKKRYTQKAQWRSNKPCDQYQNHYRQTHPGYVTTNRKQQSTRNNKRVNLSTPPVREKIVKTDTLLPESLLSGGLYTLHPYYPDTSKKIVKTDTLIVTLQSYQGFQGQELTKT